MISVMLVDDHAVVRMGFKLLLESASDIKVVAEAENGEQGIKLYAEHHPNVVVMDITIVVEIQGMILFKLNQIQMVFVRMAIQVFVISHPAIQILFNTLQRLLKVLFRLKENSHG